MESFILENNLGQCPIGSLCEEIELKILLKSINKQVNFSDFFGEIDMPFNENIAGEENQELNGEIVNEGDFWKLIEKMQRFTYEEKKNSSNNNFVSGIRTIIVQDIEPEPE